MANEPEYVERTVEAPGTVTREEVRVVGRSSNAGWWVAAVIAIVAVVGVIFYMNNSTSQADLQAARDQGMAQGALATAANTAQNAADQASQSAQDAARSTARATENAASVTAQAAQNTADAAQDAVTTEPAPPQ